MMKLSLGVFGIGLLALISCTKPELQQAEVDQVAWIQKCEASIKECSGDLVFFEVGEFFPQNSRIWMIDEKNLGDSLAFLQSFSGNEEIEKIVVNDNSPAYQAALLEHEKSAYNP